MSPGPHHPRSSVGSLGGRSSVVDQEPNYSNYNNSQYNNSNFNNSVFDEAPDYNIYSEYPGGVTPLSRPAPRAVFDEDEQEPRPPGGQNLNRQQASPQHGSFFFLSS